MSVKYVVSFPAQGKNGHTLVAACLDAHPQVVITNTYGSGCGSIEEILETSSKESMWDKGAKYKFNIPGQGEWEDVKVVGTTNNVTRGCENLTRKNILVMRNPFDVIGSRYRKTKNLRVVTNMFFQGFERALKLDNLMFVCHEEWIKNPIDFLFNCADWLEIKKDMKWAMRCADLINPYATRSFYRAPWDEESVRLVDDFIKKFPEFKRYI
ncbi:MAG: hypothetical protein R3321_11105 [Nitrososphaeraceae archaeon]|nr:hypothetical protein [Nitrososphaeraceae archaeon]